MADGRWDDAMHAAGRKYGGDAAAVWQARIEDSKMIRQACTFPKKKQAGQPAIHLAPKFSKDAVRTANKYSCVANLGTNLRLGKRKINHVAALRQRSGSKMTAFCC